MGFTFKIDTKAKVIFSVADGKITAGEVADLRRQIKEHPDFRHREFDHLVDYRKARFQRTGDDMLDSTKWFRAEDYVKRLALVGEKTVGLARMMQGWLVGQEIRVRAFPDMESAREWFGLPPEE
jgi:hypothetical protein